MEYSKKWYKIIHSCCFLFSLLEITKVRSKKRCAYYKTAIIVLIFKFVAHKSTCMNFWINKEIHLHENLFLIITNQLTKYWNRLFEWNLLHFFVVKIVLVLLDYIMNKSISMRYINKIYVMQISKIFYFWYEWKTH